MPLLGSRTDDWGAFLFFAGWGFLSLVYVFLAVPETAGLSLEQTDALFKGPWLIAYRSKKPLHSEPSVIEGIDAAEPRYVIRNAHKIKHCALLIARSSDDDLEEEPDKKTVFAKQDSRDD